MPREKRYVTPAERQAAYRARKRAQEGEAHSLEADASDSPELDAELLSDLEEHELRHRLGYSSSETHSKAERDQAARRMTGKPPLTEEEYVKHQLEQTWAYAESFRSPEKSSLVALGKRMRNAERYARWRWRAYSEGEVFSL